MSNADDNHDGPAADEPQPPNETQGSDQLVPHLTVVRQLTYRGNKPAIVQAIQMALPDGLFILATPGGTPVGTIEVKTAPPEEIVPEWLGVVKAELIAQAKQRREDAQKGTILNPHTLRPVRKQ